MNQLTHPTRTGIALSLTVIRVSGNRRTIEAVPLLWLTAAAFWLWSLAAEVNALSLALAELAEALAMVARLYAAQFSILALVIGLSLSLSLNEVRR